MRVCAKRVWRNNAWVEMSAIIILRIIALNVLKLGRHVGNDRGLNGSKVCTRRNLLPDAFPLQSTLPADFLLSLTGLLPLKFKTLTFPNNVRRSTC